MLWMPRRAPLLLAMGSERYVPFEERKNRRNCSPRPTLSWDRDSFPWPSTCSWQRLTTIRGWTSMMSARSCSMSWPGRLARDLHFQTQTTIDTLDYSGTG